MILNRQSHPSVRLTTQNRHVPSIMCPSRVLLIFENVCCSQGAVQTGHNQAQHQSEGGQSVNATGELLDSQLH